MTSSLDPSSSMSFISSSPTRQKKSNGSDPDSISLEMISLGKLSNGLEHLLFDTGSDFSDADIVVEGRTVRVHRCILAAMSRVFHGLFRNGKESSSVRPRYCLEELLPGAGKVGHEAFDSFLTYLYTEKLKPSPPEVSTCVNSLCAHDSCRSAISFAVEMMFASSAFQVSELVSLFQV